MFTIQDKENPIDSKLAAKVELMGQNYVTVSKSGKLEFGDAACLGALLLTQSDCHADEARIRDCRKLLKRKAGIFSNFRGCCNLALLCKMALRDNPEAYIDDVMNAYGALAAGKVLRSETLVFAATAMAEQTDEGQYGQVSQEVWNTIAKMRQAHPLLTDQDDAAIVATFIMAGLDVDQTLSEAEEVYARLKSTGFKLNKDALQSISLVLAMSGKPIDEKCQRFVELRQALKDAGHRIGGDEMVVLSAFVDMDVPIQTIVAEIAEADNALKSKKGFGSVLGCGSQLRRLFASALVLRTHEEENIGAAASQASTLASIVVEQVIMMIILLIIIMSVQAASRSH